MVEGPDTNKTEEAIQQKNEVPKRKLKEEKQPTKVVIRRLPGTMTEESFLEHVSPLFEHDYFYFVRGNCRDGNFSRVYINFVNVEDVFTFTEKFDDYVFIDSTGQEFPAVVEFAPFQRIPKNRTIRKSDPLCGTIEEDTDYQEFLQFLESEEQDHKQLTEHYFDLANDENEEKVTSTPLIEYLTSKKNDWLKYKEEKKEVRRRRDVERRKLKEETKRVKKELKEAHKTALEKIAKIKEDKKKDCESKQAVDDAKSSSVRVKGKSYQEERQRDLARRKQEEKPLGSGDMKEIKNIDFDRPSTSEEREGDSKIGSMKDESKSDRGDKNDSNYKKDDKKSYRDDDRRYSYGRDRDDKKMFYNQKKHSSSYEYDKFKSSKRDGHYYEDYKTRNHTSFHQKGSHTNKMGTSSRTKESDDKLGKRFEGKRRGDEFKEVKKGHQFQKEHRPAENKDTDKKPSAEVKTKNEREEILRHEQEHGGQDRSSNRNTDGEPRMKDSNGDPKKDDRAERRIKNKDRPALEIYRPGMGKFSRQRIERNKSTDKEED